MTRDILLSVVVSVFNGEKDIDDCLKSASFADEIIVVDNSSTDKTVEIAKKYTKNIYTKENKVMLNINKNFGFKKASGKWILSLDADERVTGELEKEIEEIVRNETILRYSGERSDSRIVNGNKRFWTSQNDDKEVSGYWIPRKNIIFGKWIEHSGWYPDYQLRLFQREKGKFPGKHVHEMIEIKGESQKLKEHILHYNYNSINQFLHKLSNIYGPNEAEQLIKKGYIFDWKDAIRFPVSEFLSRFFSRKGYKDGFHGLYLSLLMGFYHLIVLGFVWEKTNFKKIDNKDILHQTEIELKKSSKELFYWFSKEKIDLIRSPFLKYYNKLIRKINS